MLSFIEYASEKRILELLIKERVKAALGNKLKEMVPANTIDKVLQDEELTTAEQIFMLMPTRDSWCRPQKKDRIQKDGNEKKSEKQILTRSIALTIKKHRKSPDKYPYLQRLDTFIEMLRKEIASDRPLEFNSITISGKKKKVTGEEIIMRPLCSFNLLRDKLLIALANKYLSEAFDPLLHEEILSYRPLRNYHNSAEPVLTDRENAIANLEAYRKAHRKERIYVAECDIQKYFDTINHDVIRCCFSRFAEKTKEQHPEFEYAQVERIVDAYLRSYSFYKNIAVRNAPVLEKLSKLKEQKALQKIDAEKTTGKKSKKQKKSERKANRTKKLRIYEEPKKGLFLERGCYTQEEFEASTDRIGIPQGGALSGLISNVVLNTVDNESVLEKKDPKRFFCRYGDDIILMHTSKKECKRLMDQYSHTLTKHKLLYHDFISVADQQFRKPDGTIRTSLWDQKSRSPFLWGRSKEEKESVDWIGFLGYELRYTGEIRLRRSSLNDKFKNIKRKYCNGAKTKIAKGTFKKDLDTEILNRIEHFKSDGLVTAKSLNRNKYSMTQAMKLNRYASGWLYRLLYKIARRNNLKNEELAYWWEKAKEAGCFNYTKFGK